jgi:hypothetical protein
MLISICFSSNRTALCTEHDKADAAVDRAVQNIVGEIEKLFDTVSKLESVALDWAGERLLLKLADVLLERVVDKIPLPGPQPTD